MGRIIQDNNIKKVESDKDSLGDDKEFSSDSDDADSEGYDALDGFSFKMLKNISSSIATQLKLEISSSKSSSESSLNEIPDSESESGSEDSFNPELFGLMDNPGVLRFDSLDYPLTVIEDCDDEDNEDTATDDLGHDTERYSLSKSLDNIKNIYGDERRKDCDCQLFSYFQK